MDRYDIEIPASLHLNTGQIDPDTSVATVNNLIGGWDGARQSFYFNVKMRNVLGEMYERHDKFVISVVQIFAINSVANTVAVPLQLQMGGLSWVNSSYEQVSQANGYWVAIMNTLHANGASGTSAFTYDILSNSFVFRKGDPDVRMDFRYMNITTNQPATVSSGIFPTTSIFFKIQPLIE
jgi:hypothetical protein